MKKKSIIVRGPALSMSGYGEQTRFALRALRKYEKNLDIYVIPTGWGQTGWVHDDTDERQWLDKRIFETVAFMQQGGKPDYSLQVTIPNEFNAMAPVNIGYTAGMETTKVEPQWLEVSNNMDKIIVVSNHSKNIFENTTYDGVNKTNGQPMHLKCEVPVDAVNFGVSEYYGKTAKIDLDLEHDFNYLVVAQNGPRKNLVNTIKWFVEENLDQDVGLVLKIHTKSGCRIDRDHTRNFIKEILQSPEYEDRKCKVYLLHGDLKPEEMQSLYAHPKIKAFISLSHGEGFGLPIFEAACHGIPIITTGWSGQVDYLYMPTKKKVGRKFKMIDKPCFAEVDFDIQPVQDFAVWDGVVGKDSKWAYPKQGSYKMRLRQVRKNYDKFYKKAERLKKWIHENFQSQDQYDLFIKSIGIPVIAPEDVEYVWVSDFFASQLTGGAELSLQALIDKSPGTGIEITSSELTEEDLEFYKDRKWVFGNIANLNPNLRDKITSMGINYAFVEFDYKFCEYRNPLLYENLEEEACDYSSTELGKAITAFVNNSEQTFFMSEKQKDIYLNKLSDLDENKLYVLSSIFNDEFFEKIDSLRQSQNGALRDKWIVMGSRSWVKGAEESEQYCKDNNLNYEVVFGVENDELLKKLSSAKGICFKPTGLDTCPRFVIEAKLLGCELELNENVQHAEEDWFKTDNLDTTVAYLKDRPAEFWTRVHA